MPATAPRSKRRYVSPEDAAEYCGGIHPRTIRRMISRGELTGYRLGPRLVRVDLDEIDKAMRVIPTAASGGSDG